MTMEPVTRYTPKRETFAPVRLRETARAMVSSDPFAPVLACTWCLRDCDTYADGGDEFMVDNTANAIHEFLEHTLYDHSGRAGIQQTRVETIISWDEDGPWIT